jgi:hypothetical protein
MTVARNEMPEITKFQIEREQYLNFEVLCVSWSEKYDVLALATSTGKKIINCSMLYCKYNFIR